VAALKEGRQAYEFGEAVADCRYPAGDPRHAAWLRGFAAGQEASGGPDRPEPPQQG